MLPTAGVAAVLAAFLCSRKAWCSVFVHAAVLFTGWLNAELALRPPSSRELAVVMKRPIEHVALVGVIVDDPVRTQGASPDQAIWKVKLRVEGIRRIDQWQRVRGQVTARWKDGPAAAELRYGQRWLVTGPLHDLGRTDADPRHFTRSRYWMDIGRTGNRLLESGQGARLRAWSLVGRRYSADLLSVGIEKFQDEIGLAHALLLGYRPALPTRVQEAFARTGTLHIVAISGLHVGVMALLIVAALKATGVSRPNWIWFIAPLLVLYTLGTGMANSAVRACVMAFAFWSAYLFRRKPDAPSALALAAIVILAVRPTELLAPGFLLSFVVVAGLLTMVPAFMRSSKEWSAQDPMRVAPESWWSQRSRGLLEKALSLAAVSTAAWLASTPLIIYFFNLFSPIALLANLFVVPMAFVILLTGCLSLIFGSLHPVLAEIFNHANRVFIDVLLRGIELFQAVPGGHYFVAAPAVGWVLMSYLALMVLFFGGHVARWCMVGALLAATGWGAWRWLNDDRVRIDVMSAGPVNVMFVDVPGGGDILVDTGPASQSRQLIQHLRRRGVDRIHAVVLSRATVDAGGGLLKMLDAMLVEEVWCTPHESRSRAFAEVLAAAERRGVSLRRLSRGDGGEWPGHVEWEVLHPGPDATYRSAGEAGIALRVARGPSSILFLSEGGRSQEGEILNQRIDPTALALVLGSAGPEDTCSREWLAAVLPRWVVFTKEQQERRGVLSQPALERLAGQGATVLGTGSGGRLEFQFAPLRGSFREPPLQLRSALAVHDDEN